MNTNRVLKIVQSLATEAQRTLDKFAEDFAKDPQHALAWSGATFKAAAQARLAAIWIHALENGATPQAMYETMRDEVLTVAKYTPSSTSVVSNLSENEARAVRAELLDRLKWAME